MNRPAWTSIVRVRLAGKWQIPLLITSLAVLGVSISMLVKRSRQVTVGEWIVRTQKVAAAGRDAHAVRMAEALLSEAELDDSQRRQLYAILAGSLYRIEKNSESHDRQRVVKFIRYHLQAAEARDPDAEDYYRLGWANLWLGQDKKALENFTAALEAGHGRSVALHRQIADLLLRVGDKSDAVREQILAHLDAILSQQQLSQGDLVWSAGKKVEMLLERNQLQSAWQLIEQVLPRITEDQARQEMEYTLALCELSLGQVDKADRMLRALKRRFGEQSELDAKVTLRLGWLNLGESRPAAALGFFKEVGRNYYGSEYHASAVLGQAEALAMLQRYAASERAYVLAGQLLDQIGKNALVTKDQLLASISRQWLSLRQSSRLDEAIRFGKLQERLSDRSDELALMALWQALADLHADLAATCEGGSAKANENYIAAAEYYLKLLQIRGLEARTAWEAMWSAAQCYEKGGKRLRSIEVLEKMIHDWPQHSGVAEAVYLLGKAYQALGQYSRAAEYYQRAVTEYGRTTSGKSSMVPLARCYMLMSPPQPQQAEAVLRSIVDDTSNQQLFTPEAWEFRSALFLLGRLHYLQGDYRLAISRLEEALQRYEDDSRCGQALFIMAQSYRAIAAQFESQMQQTEDRVLIEKLQARWREHMQRAYQLYDRTITFYESHPSADELSASYVKLGCLYSADCQYDLGNYEASIRLYEKVADRYERQPVSLAAYVQIINAYQRLGQRERIKAALQRMSWLLRNMPEGCFEGMFDRQFWQDWINWNYISGLVHDGAGQLLASGSQ